MKRKYIDSRNGPVTVVSKDELKNRQPTTEGFLAPKGISVVVSPYYYEDKKSPITITDTELFDLAKASADKLNPKERQALALFRVQITRGDELTERQQGFLYSLIEKCRNGPVRQKTMLSPEEFEQRRNTRNALIAFLHETANTEHALLVFSKERLDTARSELLRVVADLSVRPTKGLPMNKTQVVDMLLEYILKRIGYSNTHIYLGMFQGVMPFKLFFRKDIQESAISYACKNLEAFPKELGIALQDHPFHLTVDQLIDIVDGMYVTLITPGSNSLSISSVKDIPAGSPGSGKGGVNH